MNFLTPLFAWSAIIPFIVLLYYFFRKKYKQTTVSSTLFWEEAMRETRVSPYIQKLQKNSLLFLQLAALILLVLALMQPYVKKGMSVDEQLIIIFDSSASTAHKDTFEKNKNKLKQLIEKLNGQEVTIIQTGYMPKTIVQKETDVKKLVKQVDEMTLTYEQEHLSKAIQVANSIAQNNPSIIYIYSDSVEKDYLQMEKEHVRYVVEGGDKIIDNVSLRRFKLAKEDNHITALAEITNEADQEKQVQLFIRDEENQQLHEVDLLLDANETWTDTFQLPNISNAVAEIKVNDSYQLDNQIHGFIEKKREIVHVHPQIHPVIMKGLQAITDQVKITDSQAENIIIVTNEVDQLMGTEPILLFGRNDATLQKAKGQVRLESDVLFAFSSFENAIVQSVYPPFDDAKTIAWVGDDPFIQRTKAGDIIVLTELTETDMSVTPDFPLFLWSAIEQLAIDQQVLGVYKPNDEVLLSLQTGEWDIYKENEFIQTIAASELARLPVEPGKYEVRQGQEVKDLYIELEVEEKTIIKGSSYEVGVKQDGKEDAAKSSIVPYILLLILIFLLVEWEVQRRHGLSNG